VSESRLREEVKLDADNVDDVLLFRKRGDERRDVHGHEEAREDEDLVKTGRFLRKEM
jgi:hypothetical protein